MSDANPERGEVPILLGGKSYPMRPSYAAIKAIELALGPVVALATKLAHPLERLSVDALSIIVTEAIRAAGKDRDDKVLQAFTPEKVAELIFDQGILSAIEPVEVLLVNMITGGGEAKKKPSGVNRGKRTTTGS